MAKLTRKYYPIIFTAIVAFTMSCILLSHDKVSAVGDTGDPQTLETIQKVFLEAGSYSYDEPTDLYTVYDAANTQIGYAFYAKGMSYYGESDGADGFKMGGPMVIMVGLEDAETIHGIFVVSQKEDAQYWSYVVLTNFFRKFEGLKIESCALSKLGGEVDAASGATLSSMSIVDIVREAALFKVIPGKAVTPEVNKMEWQVKVALGVVLPIVLIPVVFMWYSNIKQAFTKRSADPRKGDMI